MVWSSYRTQFESRTVRNDTLVVGILNITETLLKDLSFRAVYTDVIMTKDLTPGSRRLPTDETDSKGRRFSYDWTEHQPIGVSIIQSVAAVADVDPLSLQPRLYDVLDPDALETLLSSGTDGNAVHVTFAFGVYDVTVTNSGDITVRDTTLSN